MSIDLYKNFGFEKFERYSLNECVYVFNDIFTKDNEFYKRNEKGNYSHITITSIFDNKFVKLRDVNGNLICVKVEKK